MSVQYDGIFFKKVTLKNIFVSSIKEGGQELLACRYKIPDFQRNYIWKKEQINKLIELIFSARGYYYLGNIVLLGTKVGYQDNLIDGQQRLITLSLILNVIRMKTGNIAIQNVINEVLLHYGDNRIVFTNKITNKHYRNCIKLGDDIPSLNSSLKNMGQAVKIINANSSITRLVKDVDIREVVKKILKIEFGTIKCFNSDEVYNLFEGLNSTGIILTTVEKTKNIIFGKINDLDSSRDKRLYNKYTNLWKKIEIKFEQTGNLFMFNRFVRHHWYLYEGKVSDRQLYEKIKKKIIENNVDINIVTNYVDRLNIDSGIYLDIRSRSPKLEVLPNQQNKIYKSETVKYINFINNLGLEQVYPVLLSIYKHGIGNKNYFTNGTFHKHVLKIWAFCILAKYGKIIPNQYEGLFANICKYTVNDKSINWLEKSAFKSMHSIVESSKNKFIKNFANTYREEDEKMAFELLSRAYSVPEAGMSLEHILPKGKGGSGSFSKWKKIPEEDYERVAMHLSKIGNLSLIEKQFNTDCGDESFEDKTKIYLKSAVNLTKEIPNYLSFTISNPIKAVEKRGKSIAEDIFGVLLDLLK